MFRVKDKIIDRSEPVKNAMRERGAIFIGNYVSQEDGVGGVIYQRWLCRGNIVILECHSDGGYAMYSALPSNKVIDDIDYINNLK